METIQWKTMASHPPAVQGQEGQVGFFRPFSQMDLVQI